MTLDHAGLSNGMRRGWDAAMGLRRVRATQGRVRRRVLERGETLMSAKTSAKSEPSGAEEKS
jgi:hypothetical protein